MADFVAVNAPSVGAENGNVLEIRGLTKSYKNKSLVLNDMSLTIPKGRIFGLLGPNGCGKSTLIKLVTGLLIPDGGKILIDGKPRSEKTNALVSYLPERTYFRGKQTVLEMIDYFLDFFADFDAGRARHMLQDLGIPMNVPLCTLSKGTKEKVQLIFVMARRAKLYILDEPIGGVDPAARDYILSTIIGTYSPDSAILITTHLLADIENVLDDFAFIGEGGKILLTGNADDVRAEYGKSLNEIFKEVFPCSGNV